MHEQNCRWSSKFSCLVDSRESLLGQYQATRSKKTLQFKRLVIVPYNGMGSTIDAFVCSVQCASALSTGFREYVLHGDSREK